MADLELLPAQAQIRIRSRATGETFIGNGAVPPGYDLIGPAGGPAPAPAPPAAPAPAEPASPTSLGQSLVRAADQRIPFGGAIIRGTLPTLGTIGGGLAGGLISSPTIAGVPAGVLGGEAAGSLFGEWLNQRLGITEPSTTQLAIAAASPAAGRVVAGGAREAVRLGARLWPGSAGALNEAAQAAAQRAAAMLSPAQAVEDLYNVVSRFKVRIPTENLSAAIEKLGQTEGQLSEGLQSAPIRKVIDGLREQIAQAPNGELDFQALRQTLKRLGDRVGAAARSGGEEYGAFKLLRGAALSDLEAAAARGNPAMPAVQALQVANAAAKREFAAGDLESVIGKAIGKPRPGDAVQEFRPGDVLGWLKGDSAAVQQFRKSLPADEVAKLTSLFEGLTKSVRRLPPPVGAQYGSAKTGLAMAAGGALGETLGIPGGGWAGAALGGLLPYSMSRAAMTEPGRNLLLHLMQSGPFLDHRAASILAAFTGSQFAGAPAGAP